MSDLPALLPLIASTDLMGEPDALRARVADDGYVFLPGLLARDHVAEVREQVCRVLAEVGWTEPGTDPVEARPGPTAHRHDHKDLGWYDGYVGIQKLEAFHALAHDPALIRAMSILTDDDTVVVHPLKIARITFPGTDFPTPAHQDFFFVPGSPNAFTAWIPLGDYPVAFGGLRVLPGSHRRGLREHVGQPGAGGNGLEIDLGSPQWRGADYRMGDVLAFNALTVHRGPNNEGDRLRISADYRYQSVREPLLAACLEPHDRPFADYSVVPGWEQLTAGWSSLEAIAVPDGVDIVSDPRIPS